MDLMKNFISLSKNLEIVSTLEVFSLSDRLDFGVLSSKELEICSKFTSAKRKDQFVAGRIACKKAFFSLITGNSNCFDKLSSISVLNTETGAPFIENFDFCVSISHSHELAIASISRYAIGVDIERIDSKRTSALKRMSAECPSEDVRDLTAFWTLKESLGKALRTGIVEGFERYQAKNLYVTEGIYRCEFKNFPFLGIAITDTRYAIGIVVKDRKNLLSIDF